MSIRCIYKTSLHRLVFVPSFLLSTFYYEANVLKNLKYFANVYSFNFSPNILTKTNYKLPRYFSCEYDGKNLVGYQWAFSFIVKCFPALFTLILDSESAAEYCFMTVTNVSDFYRYWVFGEQFCDTWVACDVMCSTASILNLCAISLDRYIHIKDPLR